MRKLILLMIAMLWLNCVFANKTVPIKGTDTLLLKKLVDSLNIQVQKHGMYKFKITVQKNGDVNILREDRETRFNFFELSDDQDNNGGSESKYGIRIDFCDPRSHAPRNSIYFTKKDEVIDFLFFKCRSDHEARLLHQLILSIRKQCVERKDYLK